MIVTLCAFDVGHLLFSATPTPCEYGPVGLSLDNSDYCVTIDSASGTGAGISSGDLLYLYPCNPLLPVQAWLTYSDNTLRPRDAPGLCMDVKDTFWSPMQPGSALQVFTCNGGANQAFVPSNNDPIICSSVPVTTYGLYVQSHSTAPTPWNIGVPSPTGVLQDQWIVLADATHGFQAVTFTPINPPPSPPPSSTGSSTPDSSTGSPSPYSPPNTQSEAICMTAFACQGVPGSTGTGGTYCCPDGSSMCCGYPPTGCGPTGTTTQQCLIQPTWGTAGNWSSCSVTACGLTGTETRSVSCINHDGSNSDPTNCDSTLMPATSRPCQTPACPAPAPAPPGPAPGPAPAQGGGGGTSSSLGTVAVVGIGVGSAFGLLILVILAVWCYRSRTTADATRYSQMQHSQLTEVMVPKDQPTRTWM